MTTELIEFVTLMARETTISPPQLEQVIRLSEVHQALCETWCNRGLTPREEKRLETIRAEILELLPEGCGAVFGGDPRGATVKITVPSGRTNDWGGEGICVPT